VASTLSTDCISSPDPSRWQAATEAQFKKAIQVREKAPGRNSERSAAILKRSELLERIGPNTVYVALHCGFCFIAVPFNQGIDDRKMFVARKPLGYA
jgi:hypothetical protein